MSLYIISANLKATATSNATTKILVIEASTEKYAEKAARSAFPRLIVSISMFEKNKSTAILRAFRRFFAWDNTSTTRADFEALAAQGEWFVANGIYLAEIAQKYNEARQQELDQAAQVATAILAKDAEGEASLRKRFGYVGNVVVRQEDIEAYLTQAAQAASQSEEVAAEATAEVVAPTSDEIADELADIEAADALNAAQAEGLLDSYEIQTGKYVVEVSIEQDEFTPYLVTVWQWYGGTKSVAGNAPELQSIAAEHPQCMKGGHVYRLRSANGAAHLANKIVKALQNAPTVNNTPQAQQKRRKRLQTHANRLKTALQRVGLLMALWCWFSPAQARDTVLLSQEPIASPHGDLCRYELHVVSTNETFTRLGECYGRGWPTHAEHRKWEDMMSAKLDAQTGKVESKSPKIWAIFLGFVVCLLLFALKVVNQSV